MVKKKEASAAKLTTVLDLVFSRYIRLRDTDRDGFCHCIDCDERIAWRDIQCGHFMSRTAKSTRWDEQNCAAQKASCNTYGQGRQFEFGKALDVRYGEGTADRLHIKSKQVQKWATWELKEMIEKYQELIKKLSKSKNFQPFKT